MPLLVSGAGLREALEVVRDAPPGIDDEPLGFDNAVRWALR